MTDLTHPSKTGRRLPSIRFSAVASTAALVVGALILGAALAQTASPSASAAQGSSSAPGGKPDAKKAKAAYLQGVDAEKDQDWDAAYTDYTDATNFAPNDKNYAMRRELAKSRLVQSKVDAAERDAAVGKLDDARRELFGASYLDPTNEVVAERLKELLAVEEGQAQKVVGAELGAEPHLAYQRGTHSFDFRGDTQGAYEELARQFGVDVAFDVDLHSRQVRFRVDDVDFPTAARLLGDMTGTFWQTLSPRLFFVTENTPQKRKDYEASALRTVLLPASETPDQMTEILRLVREIAGVTRSDLDAQSRTLTLRAPPRAISVATDLIDDLERPVGEMVLEVEVLDVDRNYARQLGITPPQTAQAFTLSSMEIQEAEASYAGLIDVIEAIFGGSSSTSGSLIPPLVAFGGGKSTFLATLPGATANFSAMLSLVRSGQRILLRAQDGQPATFFVGERYPVSLSTFAPSLVPGSASPGSSTSPLTNYPTGNAPSFVATASLRGDNINDLVVTNSGDNTISVLLGNGEGIFSPQVTYATGTDPVWIATGQFNNGSLAANNDQFLDLAVVNAAADTVSILLGNGDGTFQPKTDIATGHTPVSVVSADFHDLAGNGFNDLAVANEADNSVSIFQGNGDGTFQAPTSIQLPAGYEPSALAEADLNNDGHSDLVVADKGNNTISVFLGNGDGTFQTRTDYPSGNAPVYVAIGDFNADGGEDIAVANNGVATSTDSGDSVTVYYNQKSTSTEEPLGTFVQGPTRDFAAGGAPTSLAIADYNGDGSPDILITDESDNAVTVLLNGANQTFTALPELPVGTAPVSVASADFNGDGRPDAAVADNGAAEATVILNTTSLFGAGINGVTGTPYPGIQYLDIGLKAKATPRIHPDDNVTLQLSFEISSLGSQSYNSIPVISNESVDQTVRVKQNETAIVAGFLQSQITNGINGTPGIGEAPGIGYAAGDQNLQDQSTELLILVTPRMVRLAPHQDRVIYAGQGSLDSAGASTGAPRPPPPAAAPAPTPPPETPAAGAPTQPSPTAAPGEQSGAAPPQSVAPQAPAGAPQPASPAPEQ